MKVSIIVPAWNEEKVLGETLARLQKLDFPKKDCEIIVIAGGADGTYEIAKGFLDKMKDFDNFKVLEQGPFGKNAALQKGVNEISPNTDVIAILDSDTLVDRGWLKKAVKKLQNKRISALNTDYYPLGGLNYISIFYLYEKIKSNYILKSPSLYGGGGILIKRHLLEDVGVSELFDEDVHVGVDYHLTNKLAEKGYPIAFAEGAKVYTRLPRTFKEFLNSEVRWLNAWFTLSKTRQGFGLRIIKNLLVTLSLVGMLVTGLLGLAFQALIISVPFGIFSLRVLSDGLKVYRHAGDGVFLKYLWAYLLLSTIFQLLITFTFIRGTLFGYKLEKHFKGPRSRF